MAVELEKIALEFTEKGYVEFGKVLLRQVEDARRLGMPEWFDGSASLVTPQEIKTGEVKQFSQEARKALEREGYHIYTLTGQSISSLRESGRKFRSTWHQGSLQFEALPSIQSEVAINPNQVWLPGSNEKTLTQQENMINKFSQVLSKKIPGVVAIMGGVADYTELAFTHLDQTGDYFFGKSNYFIYARTNTPVGGADVADVGCFDIRGLSVGYWRQGKGHTDVFAVPLVVPNV